VERKLILTEDGSHTVTIPELNVNYHSIYGAIQESRHVFIHAGLHYILNSSANEQVAIFEMGFGTGLNALLTLIEAEKLKQKIYYETVELFPLADDEVKSLNYCEILNRIDLQASFEHLHNCECDSATDISGYIAFSKFNTSLVTHETSRPIDLIFFDAFDPAAQPELWTENIFKKMYSILRQNGVLVTYSSKGSVRRAMQAAGFQVEKIPGPARKREILRATRVI
jgi:tRNA U34 5-methylaminomethyl-2-thiouridine-forming methyltransferase MnmC